MPLSFQPVADAAADYAAAAERLFADTPPAISSFRANDLRHILLHDCRIFLRHIDITDFRRLAFFLRNR